MPNQAAAQLLAKTLVDGPVHPGVDGGKPFAIPLATFRQAAAMPADMAKQFADEAGLPDADIATRTSEALIARLEADGYAILGAAELQDLRTAAAQREPQRHQQLDFHCNCGVKLFRADIRDFDTDRPKISPNVIKAVQALSAECALGHQAGA